MATATEAAFYISFKSSTEIGTRLVPYFYLYEEIGRPIKNYTFAILFCSLAGPLDIDKLMNNKALNDLLEMTNYGETSSFLGNQIERWASLHVSDFEWNDFTLVYQKAIERTEDIADETDRLMRKAISKGYSVKEMIPALSPLGELNDAFQKWPLI